MGVADFTQPGVVPLNVTDELTELRWRERQRDEPTNPVGPPALLLVALLIVLALLARMR